MSKRIDIGVALRTLTNKKCKIFQTLDSSVDVIDISKAEDLGNKSWGYIDYLVKNGYSIVGWGDLNVTNSKTYPSKETNIAKPNKSVIKVEEKKWHSYADFSHPSNFKGKEYTSSELSHLRMLNHLMTKFDRTVFKKGRRDRKELKDIKKNLNIQFTGTKIFSSDFEKVQDIPSNRK